MDLNLAGWVKRDGGKNIKQRESHTQKAGAYITCLGNTVQHRWHVK